MTQLDTDILELARSRRAPYLAALTASPAQRPALLAVLAFDAELARIPGLVSEPMLGRIRLQWWSDVLPGVVGGRPPSHPVARALAPLGLPLEGLRSLVEGHIRALEGDAGPAGDALLDLMAEVTGLAQGEAREAVREVGRAWALAERGGAEEEARALLARARRRELPRETRAAARPLLRLAPLAERLLERPGQPLGVGAVLALQWAQITGRY